MSPIKKLLALLSVLVLASLPLFAVNALTSLQTDTFTRANASTLGTNWGAVNNNGGCQILSNQAKPLNTTINGTCLYNSIDWPNDQGAQATMATIASIGSQDIAAVIVRGQFWQNSTNGYFAGSFNTADTKIHLVRIISNSYTGLATSAANIVVGDVIQLQVQGCNPTNLTVLQNGTPVPGMNPFVDSNGLGPCSGSPGIYVAAVSDAVANAGVTNWTGYAVSNPPVVNNSAPFPIAARATSTNIGNLTGASQALQFTLPSSVSRIQIIVGSTTGTVTSPAWSLECSQDAGVTWFGVAAQTVPNVAPQLGDIFPIYAPYYDVFGLAGASCKFGLGATTGTVSGTLPVWVVIG